MAKRTGLGQKFYVCSIGSGPAYDLSGDIGSIDSAVCSFAVLDDTGLDKSAMERLVGQGDGSLAYTSFWNNATGGAQAVLSGLTGLPVRGLWLGSATEGDGLAYAIHGIFDSYSPARAQSASLTAKNSIKSSSGDLPDLGALMGIGTDASGTNNHTAFDFGLVGAGLTISGNTQANPTVITTTTPHGLITGDSVNITGSNSNPVINGDWPVTSISGTTFSVPKNVTTGAGTAGTVTKSSTNYGAVLVGVLISIGTGTNFTVKLQHSADNGVADTYADLTGLVTSSLVAAAAESRVRSSHTLTVKRYMRAVTQGTYTNANFVAIAKRIAGVE